MPTNLTSEGHDEPSSTAHHHKTIERAAKTQLVLQPLGTEYDTFTVDGDDGQPPMRLDTTFKWKEQMSAKSLKWAFKLAEQNVGPFYRSCQLGWQPKQKQADLNKNWARYLVLTDRATKQAVAYTMFRFDMDYGCSVLYCYELQIEKNYQRKGIGRFLIGLLQRLATHYGMEKLILTVLCNNPDALEFFHRVGFQPDDTSPIKSENTGYQILSIRCSKPPPRVSRD